MDDRALWIVEQKIQGEWVRVGTIEEPLFADAITTLAKAHPGFRVVEYIPREPTS